MSETLLTPLEIADRAFKKALRGYDPVEVDSFLDQIVDDMQVYAEKLQESEREIRQMKEKLSGYEELKESLQETLLFAQKSAEDRTRAAESQAEAILAEARSEAERIQAEYRCQAGNLRQEVEELRELRDGFLADFRALLSRYGSLVDSTEAAREETL